MTTTVFYRRAERFAQLLEEASGARRHHIRSRVDDDLAPLVSVGHRVTRMHPTVDLDPDFREGLRAMLVATAQREGIGATATATEGESRRRLVRPLAASRRPTGATARRARARAAVIVGIAAGTLALSGMSAASGDAVPGDALYGIKRSTERAQLALAGSDVSRGQLYLEFAKTRVAEARAVKGDNAGLAGVLGDMDDETRQGVKLLATAAVERRDPAAIDAVDRFVDGQRRSVAALLDQQPSAGARERVLESLTLLDSVTRRTAGLRTTLTCNGARGNDTLGPLPASCGTAMAPPPGQLTGPGGPVASSAGTQGRAAGTLPTGAPAAVVTPTAPPTPSEDPAAEATQEDTDGGLLSDLGRLLGGLLGN